MQHFRGGSEGAPYIDTTVRVLPIHCKSGGQIQAEWAKVISGSRGGRRPRIRLRDAQTLRAKPLACGLQQLAGDATSPVAGFDKKANDGTDLIGVGRGFIVQRVNEVPRRCVAPADGYVAAVRQIALHRPSVGAVACERTILIRRPLRPRDHGVVFVEALAIARRPLRVVRERRAIEEAQEVGQ